MDLTVILTAFKEEKTVAKAVKCICDSEYSGYENKFQLITVIPDKETLSQASKEIYKYKKVEWTSVIDPGKGKPIALNLALKKVKGKIIILTDGDVYLGENSIKLLHDAFKNPKVMGSTGRPVSADKKNNFFGYLSHLLADAAHHKRLTTLKGIRSGRSRVFVGSKSNFFALSGYAMAMKNFQLQLPKDTLVDDAYLSYVLLSKGGKLEYIPEAKVFVNYPSNIQDWYKQKLRAVGGYVQLWKFGVIENNTKVRNFWKELEYFWFPIKYAKSFKEYIWSVALYPMRLYMWLIIFYQQRIRKKSFDEIWVRVESTK
ncbi:glycosyltransferase family 2 protein [Candidatus Dojkabacteria bacterium]|uniref:Glycosyltransferase family 2 protein n=1 Tax=Candidatus Dojkabacteria bacterium TaxID=2099670 RepID=A0A955I5W2_9BACT|nr:glycosyltransferase family 2 protein [Candidatus Dojkabacteria bacterium]